MSKIMKAIIFDAFGTLFQVTDGGSARSIMQIIMDCGNVVDEKAFMEEWKRYYKKHTREGSVFKTERDIFIARIQMFFDRYGINKSAKKAADSLLADALERKIYPETKAVIEELKKKYLVFIGSNTDNAVLDSIMHKNDLIVHKVYTSENLRCYKPNPVFYLSILKKNNLMAEEVLFVGDSVTDDILGPKSIGMKTIWIDRNGVGGEYGQNQTITDLTGLLTEV